MTEEKTKKLSEVISEMRAKLSSLEGMVRNIDNNMKIMLAQVNKLSGQINGLPAKFKASIPAGIPAPAVLQPGKLPPGPPTGGSVTLPDEPSPPPKQMSSYNFEELSEEVLHKGMRRDLRKPAKASDKVHVEQRVLFSDGRTVAFAQVEIKNSKGIVIKQTRTAPSGFWKASLDPGEYQIHLVKRMGQDGTKLPVELRYPIEIIPSEDIVTLPSPEIPEIYSQQR